MSWTRLKPKEEGWYWFRGSILEIELTRKVLLLVRQSAEPFLKHSDETLVALMPFNFTEFWLADIHGL